MSIFKMNFPDLIEATAKHSGIMTVKWKELMNGLFMISDEEFLSAFGRCENRTAFSDRVLLMICLKQQSEINEAFTRIEALEKQLKTHFGPKEIEIVACNHTTPGQAMMCKKCTTIG